MNNNNNNNNNINSSNKTTGSGLAESKPLRTFSSTPVQKNNVVVRSSPLVAHQQAGATAAGAVPRFNNDPVQYYSYRPNNKQNINRLDGNNVSVNNARATRTVGIHNGEGEGEGEGEGGGHVNHPLAPVVMPAATVSGNINLATTTAMTSHNHHPGVAPPPPPPRHDASSINSALDKIAIHPVVGASAEADGIEVVRSSPAQSPAKTKKSAIAPAPVSAPLPHLRQKIQRAQQQQHHQIIPPKVEQIPIAKAIETTVNEDVDAFLAGGPCTVPCPVPDDVVGLERLYAYAKRRAWADVLSATTDMLGSSTFPYQPFYAALCVNVPRDDSSKLDNDTTISRLRDETYEIISLRIEAYILLRRYPDLKKEIQRLQLIDKDYLPFSLRVLAAKSLQYFSSSSQCLDTLYLLHQSASSLTTKIQILTTISDVFISQKEYRLALHSLDEILVMLREDAILPEVSALAETKGAVETYGTDDNGAVAVEASNHFCSALLAASRIEILSRQGRMLMQTGALKEASTVFQYAQDEIPPILSALNAANKSSVVRNILSGITIIHQAPKQLIVNEGILLFSSGDCALAMDKFRAVMEAQRQESKLQTHEDKGQLFENWLTVNDSLILPALNNMALCALYTCQLEKAVSLMESLVRENPSRYLTQELAFNLCTMYELGPDLGGIRKRVLQLIAKRFSLHDVPQTSFRSN